MAMETKDYITFGFSFTAFAISLFNAVWQYLLNTKRDRRDQQRELEQRTPWISLHCTHDEKSNPQLFIVYCNIKNQNYRPVEFIGVSVKKPNSIGVAEAELQRIGSLDRYEPTTPFAPKIKFSYFRLSEAESRDFTLMLMLAKEDLHKPPTEAVLEIEMVLKDNANTTIKLERKVSLR